MRSAVRTLQCARLTSLYHMNNIHEIICNRTKEHIQVSAVHACSVHIAGS